MKNIVIAIDGPSASGKSTVSKAVAKVLNYIYVDSGSLYRAVAWFALKKNLSFNNPEFIIEELNNSNLLFFNKNNQIFFEIEDYQPVKELRSKIVRENVAEIASKSVIRKFVVSKLKEFNSFGNLVIEGRDIGSIVYPDAEYKFFLNADLEERANRRYQELIDAGESENSKEVLESIRSRDKIDTSREEDPLIVAPGSKVIDSTNMSLSEVINLIISEISND